MLATKFRLIVAKHDILHNLYHFGTAQNISCGGMCVITQNLAVGLSSVPRTGGFYAFIRWDASGRHVAKPQENVSRRSQ